MNVEIVKLCYFLLISTRNGRYRTLIWSSALGFVFCFYFFFTMCLHVTGEKASGLHSPQPVLSGI